MTLIWCSYHPLDYFVLHIYLFKPLVRYVGNPNTCGSVAWEMSLTKGQKCLH